MLSSTDTSLADRRMSSFYLEIMDKRFEAVYNWRNLDISANNFRIVSLCSLLLFSIFVVVKIIRDEDSENIKPYI